MIPAFFELKRLNVVAEPITAEVLSAAIESAISFSLQLATATGTLWIFLDGLDEVRGAIRADVSAAILLLSERHSTSPFIVSCRILGYEDGLPDFRALELAEATDIQIERFVRTWFSTVPAQVEICLNRLELDASLQAMVRNPFLLTLYCIAMGEDDFGGDTISRRSIFEKATAALLIRREQASNTKRAVFPLDVMESILSRVARKAFAAARPWFDWDDVRDWISDDLAVATVPTSEPAPRGRMVLPVQRAEDAVGVLRSVEELSGIVRHVSDRDVAFAHLTLNEYYAARALAREPGFAVRDVIESHRYSEVIRFGCGSCRAQES